MSRMQKQNPDKATTEYYTIEFSVILPQVQA